MNKKIELKISVISKNPKLVDGIVSYWGKINIGKYKDIFVIPLSNWTIEEYKEQWKQGLERIKTYDTSCLVTDIRTIDIESKSICVEIWFLYKIDETVFLQKRILGGSILKELSSKLPEFNANTCYLYVPLRKTLTENGNKICEWQINIHDINFNIKCI